MTQDNFVASLLLLGAKQVKFKDSVELKIDGLSVLIIFEDYLNEDEPLIMISGYKNLQFTDRHNYIHANFATYHKALEFLCDS